MYEVEIKFRVDDPTGLRQLLTGRGVEFESAVEEVDQFYLHPSRNFIKTDECLRLRRRCRPDGTEECSLTYKGPKIDAETKTRREIEIPLPETGDCDALFTALGFEQKGRVRKFRSRARLLHDGRSFDILLDSLPDLEDRGETGTFVELETLADEKNLDEAKKAILELAADMGLSESIRTSYLGLLSGLDRE